MSNLDSGYLIFDKEWSKNLIGLDLRKSETLILKSDRRKSIKSCLDRWKWKSFESFILLIFENGRQLDLWKVTQKIVHEK